MDLAKINLSAQADMHLRDINGRLAYQESGEPVTITLLSNDSPPVKQQERASLNRRFANPTKIKLKMEDLDDEALDKLAVATVAINGLEINGEPVPCEFRAVKQLYKDWEFIKEQVDQFIGDRQNFLTGSQNS